MPSTINLQRCLCTHSFKSHYKPPFGLHSPQIDVCFASGPNISKKGWRAVPSWKCTSAPTSGIAMATLPWAVGVFSPHLTQLHNWVFWFSHRSFGESAKGQYAWGVRTNNIGSWKGSKCISPRFGQKGNWWECPVCAWQVFQLGTKASGVGEGSKINWADSVIKQTLSHKY